MSEQLASERVIVSAPFSFAGSAQRIWKMTNVDNIVVKIILVSLAIGLVVCTWIFVACWYFAMYVFFGFWFIPYRLLRRGSRKRKQERLRHREVLAATRKNKRL